ncbi:MAG TPA: 16S rRNA (cytidine(1402)-2'-O)-methyltransferase [Terriglobales bacterium]|nr:16S rRNA (cytidine(1402)-2'-O)-methyltransferase [Terriglobales bacterium]
MAVSILGCVAHAVNLPGGYLVAMDGKLAGMSAGEDRNSSLAPGPALYVVATPIGNLEDISYRAVRVLKEVELIACEDTRQTHKLLSHYGISTRTVSYHEHNEAERAAELQAEFERGSRIALVTDAGMPGISDPGYRLISVAIGQGVPVIPIPGAAAFLSALVASGLPTDSFRFHGFLPAKTGQRRQHLEEIRDSQVTEVFYEAPHRIREALEDVAQILGPDRHVVIGRELTKLHEEFLRGRVKEVLAILSARGEVKGEITLLIGKSEGQAPAQVSVRERLDEIMKADGLDEKAALKKLAKEMGISKSEAYRELQRSK